jgi:CPA2 family monovalent cation:H+ antiporter-2
MILSHNFLEDLAFVLSVAAVVSVIFQALKQPVVVGYLVAGMMVGPYFPFPLFADIDRIHKLSELGVILLMFALGLEFSIRKLIELAPSCGFITVVQVALMMWLGYEIGRAFGWTELEGVFTGAILAISSTTIVAKAFAEEKVAKNLSELVFGVTLFEDLAAVIILAVLTAIATGSGLSPKLIAITVGKLVFFLAALIGGGLLLVPRAIRLAARFERDETLVVASIGICFAISMIAELAGYSVALGAFLAGVLVSESGHAPKIEHLIAPMRDIFGAVFFVSVGMMLDPNVLIAHWAALLALLAVVLFGKIIAVGLGAMLSGSPTRIAVQAGMSMAQIGEFSFIIASAGLQQGATRSFLYSLAIAVSAITTFTTPFMIRASGRVGTFVDAHLPYSVRTLQSIYDSWLERMRSRTRPGSIRGPVALIAVGILAVIGIAVGYELTFGRLESLVIGATGVSEDSAEILVQGAALVLTVIPGMIIWRSAHRCAQRIAVSIYHATSHADQPAEVDQESTNLLIRILETSIAFGATTLLLAIIAPLMSLFDGLAVMIIVVAGLGIAVWRIARDLYALMHTTSGALVERLKRARELSPSNATEIADSVGVGPLMWVRVPNGSGAIGMKIGDLNLHAITGVSVMAIVRDGHSIVMPGSEEVLHAADTLAMAGSTDAVAAARDILSLSSVMSLGSAQAVVQ